MRAINWTVVKIEQESRADWLKDARYWRAKAKQWGDNHPTDKAQCIVNAMTRINWIAQNNRVLREQFSRGMY